MVDKNDLQVWHDYTLHVKPLSRVVREAQPVPYMESYVEIAPPKPTPKTATPQAPAARDLKNIQIHSRLDLHGMTLEKAHERIIAFIANAYHMGHRCVLIITGKGIAQPSEWWQEQGILRQQVPRWLSENPLNTQVSTHALAKPEHGGAGALYVFIRKKKHV